MGKIKVMLIVPSLRGGGSERVMVQLLKNLDRNKFNLSLVAIKMEGPYINHLTDDVKLFDLNKKRTLWAFKDLILLIRKQKPDIVLSTAVQLNILLLMIKPFLLKTTSILVRESSIVSMNTINNKLFWGFLYKRYYNNADGVICQSEFMKKDLIDNYRIKESKISLIYNPIDFDFITNELKNTENPYSIFDYNNSNFKIVTIGRLSEEKGHRKLINEFSQFQRSNPNAHLFVIGEGKLKQQLKDLVANLRLTENIHFIGFQLNPYNWMKYANLFILPSLYEGLPNVLLEAMTCKVPVIVSEHPGGTAEIMKITHQSNRVISKFTWENWWFNKPNIESFELLKENFNINKIINKYEEVIYQVYIKSNKH